MVLILIKLYIKGAHSYLSTYRVLILIHSYSAGPGVARGKKMFFEEKKRILKENKNRISCSLCHPQATHGFPQNKSAR